MCSWTIALTALQTYSNYKEIDAQGKAKEAMYKAQAKNAEMNAQQERRKQEQIADKYMQEQLKLDDKRRLMRGRASASAGASGLTMTGSGLDILASGEEAYLEDSTNLLTNQRYDNEASRATEANYINQANAYLASAKNVKAETKRKKVASLISGATSMYGSYKSGKTASTTSDDYNLARDYVPKYAW